jgi:hypothetical protein
MDGGVRIPVLAIRAPQFRNFTEGQYVSNSFRSINIRILCIDWIGTHAPSAQFAKP